MHAEIIRLATLGFFVGSVGTIIGAGGGFFMIPILLVLYPQDKPDEITAVSLAVICINAISGSIAYARKGKIDYTAGMTFSIAAIPGAVLGAWVTGYLPRNWFEHTFGTLMILIAGLILYREKMKPSTTVKTKNIYPIRELRDREGNVYYLSYNTLVGVSISAGIGFISSLLGIGGGIIHVPAMVNILNFPVHIATATSHFTLAVMSFFGTIAHLLQGDINEIALHRILLLSPTVILGAQIGALVSSRVNAKWIIRTLAFALLIVGVRFLLR